MRRLLIGGALGIVILVLAACGNSDAPSQAEQEALQRKADFWEIDQIEKRFHESMTLKDIDLMMGLWAPSATLTAGPGQTATGIDEIREFFLKSVLFDPTNRWISDHPAYKLDITVNGDRGTLHFECHFVNAETSELALATVADLDVARINGRWLITNLVGGSTTLAP